MKRIVFVLVVIMQLILLCSCTDKESSIYFETETESEIVLQEDSSRRTDEDDNKNAKDSTDTVAEIDNSICVYVCGQVNCPGVYELPSDSRVCDAIDKAGGMKDTASQDFWNLAETLEDGEMIYVPSVDEVSSESISSINSNGDSDDTGKININTASESELMTLTGIGRSKAKGIIEYRTKNGRFSSIDELKNVSGIGDAILNKIREQITI